MKLAEALILRGDLQKRQEQIASRIQENLLVQEGDKPAEDPTDLLKLYEENSVSLRNLVRSINATNISLVFEKGTMTDALAERDRLKMLVKVVRNAADGVRVSRPTYTRSEIRFVPTANATEMRARADKLSRELRELDMKIQQANWTADLVSV